MRISGLLPPALAIIALTAQTPPTTAPPAAVAPGTVSKVVDPKLLTHVELGLHVHGILKDPNSGDVYVSDWSFRKRWAPFVGMQYFVDDSIRRITPSGEVKRIADIPRPNGMVYNPVDKRVYIATGGGGCMGFFGKEACPGTNGIVVLDPATGEHHDLVGKEAGYADGDSASARFSQPAELALDSSTGVLYVADPKNRRIRQVTSNGTVTTLAGSGVNGNQDGAGAGASFSHIEGITYCTGDHALYVTDTDNNEIRKISLQGAVTTVAGSLESGYVDGPAAAARFNHPSGIACDNAGNLYVADRDNNLIRVLSKNGVVSTLAGATEAGTIDGVGTAARFSHPGDITFDSASGALYVVDFDSNDIRKVTTPSSGVASVSH